MAAELLEQLRFDDNRMAFRDDRDDQREGEQHPEYDKEAPEHVSERPADPDRCGCESEQSRKEGEYGQRDAERELAGCIVDDVVDLANGEVDLQVRPFAEVFDDPARLACHALQFSPAPRWRRCGAG